MDDLPDFLNRKLNGVVTEKRTNQRYAAKNGIVWPPKRNWRKIEKRRREKEKRWDQGFLD